MNTLPDDAAIRQAAIKLLSDLLSNIEYVLLNDGIAFPLLESERFDLAQRIAEEIEPLVKLSYIGQAMRINQIAFFTNPQGSDARKAALPASKILEKKFDTLLGLLNLPPIEEKQEVMPL